MPVSILSSDSQPHMMHMPDATTHKPEATPRVVMTRRTALTLICLIENNTRPKILVPVQYPTIPIHFLLHTLIAAYIFAFGNIKRATNSLPRLKRRCMPIASGGHTAG